MRIALLLMAVSLSGCPTRGGGSGDGAVTDGGVHPADGGDRDGPLPADAGRDMRINPPEDMRPPALDGALDGGPDSRMSDAGPANCPAEVARVDAEHLDDLTAAFALAGHLDGAVCAAERLHGLFPDHPLAVNNLAFAYLEAHRVDAALALLRPARMRWPDAVPILQNFALAASRAGDHAEALEAADALVAEEEDCAAEVTREVVRLRAGRAQVGEAARLILGRCLLRGLWEELVVEGLVPPWPPQHTCIPVVGVPDERSTCPSGDACHQPVVFAVPDCTVHPDACAREPAWQNYTFGDRDLGAFGWITGSWVYAASVGFTEVTCQGETECFPTAALVERSVRIEVDGPAVIHPTLTLPMLTEGALSAAAFSVVFPLFPQRVIHPSSMGDTLGCPGMEGPFYHFENQDDFDTAVSETLARLEASGGFRVDARVSVVGMTPNYTIDNHFWDEQVCPQGPYLQCQDARIIGGGNVGPPAVPESCAEPLARSFSDFEGQALAFMEVTSDSIECSLPNPPDAVPSPGDLPRALLAAALPEGSAELVLFNAPGGVFEMTLNSKGELTTSVNSGMFSLDGTVGLLDSGFDVRAGLGSTFSSGGGFAELELKVGVGLRGDREKRSIDSVYGFLSRSACLGGRLKLGGDQVIEASELRALADQISGSFSGGNGQVALSSRR